MILTVKVQNLQQKIWYIVDSEAKGLYSHEDEMKF